jgi:hypothetical protein
MYTKMYKNYTNKKNVYEKYTQIKKCIRKCIRKCIQKKNVYENI